MRGGGHGPVRRRGGFPRQAVEGGEDQTFGLTFDALPVVDVYEAVDEQDSQAVDAGPDHEFGARAGSRGQVAVSVRRSSSVVSTSCGWGEMADCAVVAPPRKTSRATAGSSTAQVT